MICPLVGRGGGGRTTLAASGGGHVLPPPPPRRPGEPRWARRLRPARPGARVADGLALPERARTLAAPRRPGRGGRLGARHPGALARARRGGALLRRGQRAGPPAQRLLVGRG